VQEFDDIYDKEIVKRYTNHEIQDLSSIKRNMLDKEKHEQKEDLSNWI
jgi:aromatic ring-opening dioxygenase LigB subunit